MAKRRITPNDVAYLVHLATHVATHIADIQTRYATLDPTKDGMRSPAPGTGSRPQGTHTDPTATAALTRPDPLDPAPIYAEALNQAQKALTATRALALAMTLLGAPSPPPMPTCSDCSAQGRPMEGARCNACARAHQRKQQRQLDQQRAGRGVTA